MNLYEQLLNKADKKGIIVKEVNLKSNSHALVKNNKIALNKKKLNTNAEKASVLAEEIAHVEKNHGNIINLNDINNLKQEINARRYSYKLIASLESIINSVVEHKLNTTHEIAEHLNITEAVLKDALYYYECEYGISVTINDYTLIFKPFLAVYQKY